MSNSANRQLYDQMTMEDKKMCEALMDLLKDNIAEDIAAAEALAEARGEARGKASGKIEGAIQLYHEEIGLAPQEIVSRIMSRFSLDEKTAQEYVENTLGLQPA